jgi:hypothetical protein
MARKTKEDPFEVLADIPPRPARRYAAVGMTVALALIVLWIAVALPQASIGYTIFLIVLGAICLWQAREMWNASAKTLQLTRSDLREEGGRVLTTIDNVERVDRGAFAFKPASGFLVKLKEPTDARVYAPGVWWRFGRTLAVGGVTGRQDGKNVADLMIVMLAQRDQSH